MEPLEGRTLLSLPTLVKDIMPGSDSGASPWFFDTPLAIGDNLYFAARNAAQGRELWKTDGTEAGTVLVKDICAGGGDSDPRYLVNFGGCLYFVADDGVHGQELWKSDGTEAGTVLVKDLYAGADSALPAELTVAGGKLYFAATESGMYRDSLYVTDGTDAGTRRIEDFNPHPSPGPAQYKIAQLLSAVGDKLFFFVSSQSSQELRVSDGTPGGTILLGGFEWTTSLFDLDGVAILGGGRRGTADQLWRSDGTPAGTYSLDDLDPATPSIRPNAMQVVGDTLFFMSGAGDDYRLWKTDGTAAGTHQVHRDVVPWGSNFCNASGMLLFPGNDGHELWRSDGTNAGTVLVRRVESADPWHTMFLAPTASWPLLFVAGDGATGRELWLSNGTAGGTIPLKDIMPGSTTSNPWYFTYANHAVYFEADDGVHGSELWRMQFEPTSAVVSASANTVGLGERITLTATVSSDAGAATGVVFFRNGSTVLGTATLNDGRAVLPNVILPPGDHSITATYTGDVTFEGSDSEPVRVTVAKILTAVAVELPVENPTFGQSVTLKATVAAQSPSFIPITGGVTFLDASTGATLGFAPLSQGVATLVVDPLSSGDHEIVAVYGGSIAYAPATASAAILSVQRATASLVIVPDRSSDLGDPPVVTATITSTLPIKPGGVVAFLVGSEVWGTSQLNGGSVTLTLAGLPAGRYDLTARYEGDGNYQPVTSNAVSQTVKDQPLLTVESSATAIDCWLPLKLQATITGAAGLGVPSGVVSFWDGDRVLGTAILNTQGQAVLTTSNLVIGRHSITAVYDGDENYMAGSSDHFIQTILPYESMVRIWEFSRVVPWGQSLLIGADVLTLHSGGIDVGVGGKAMLYEGKRRLQTSAVHQWTVAFNIANLAIGQHRIWVWFDGSSVLKPSASETITIDVRPVATTTTVTTPAASVRQGRAVTLTANVQASDESANVLPSGLVLFRDEQSVLGMATLDAGRATLVTDLLSPRARKITAMYLGDAYCSSSVSEKVALTITPCLTVDLMVVYTRSARSRMGGSDGMAWTINRAVADTNRAFDNSGIAVSLRLVHAEEVPYPESRDLYTDIVRLSDPQDGYMDSIHSLRDRYGADLVSLFVADGGDLAGLAFELFDTREKDNDTRAFSVVMASWAADPEYTLAHELGHNFGAEHDQKNTDRPGAYGYGYGYRFRVRGTEYHDIMAYPPGITIPYFSNPLVMYQGVPTGSAKANSAKVINQTAPSVAKYRPTMDTGPSGTTTTLNLSAQRSTLGRPVTLTATVRQTRGAALSQGKVLFLDGTKMLGVTDLSQGRASLTTRGLTLGDHAITAIYLGSGSASPSLSKVAWHKVTAKKAKVLAV